MKETAQISKVYFGLDPSGTLVGLFMEFETELWVASWSKATLIPGKESFIMTEKDINDEISDIVKFIVEILKAANVKNLTELVGFPVEVELNERNILRWQPKI